LTSVDGTPLDEPTAWTFVTAEPQVLSVSPKDGTLHASLDRTVAVVFNQPMDVGSVESSFQLLRENQKPLGGTFEWNEDHTEMIFTPKNLLKRDMKYTIVLPSGVKAQGGSPIVEEVRSEFYAVGSLFVLETRPTAGGEKSYYQPVEITFNAPIDLENPEDYVTVQPPVKLRFDQGNKNLWVFGDFRPEQEYTMIVSAAVTDIWGDSLEEDFAFTFRGERLDARFNSSLWQGEGVVFVNPDKPAIAAQAVNTSTVVLEMGPVSIDQFVSLNDFNNYQEPIV
jgi:hypothetical protein